MKRIFEVNIDLNNTNVKLCKSKSDIQSLGLFNHLNSADKDAAEIILCKELGISNNNLFSKEKEKED